MTLQAIEFADGSFVIESVKYPGRWRAYTPDRRLLRGPDEHGVVTYTLYRTEADACAALRAAGYAAGA